MRLEKWYWAGRYLKGFALIFLAIYLTASSMIQIRYLSTLEIKQPAIDAIGLYYEALLIPITIFLVWGGWLLLEPALSALTNRGEAE